MKLRVAYIVFLSCFMLFACKSRKGISKGNNAVQKEGLNLRSARQLKAAFIDAKKEQIIGNTEKSKSIFETVLERDPSCAACAFELAKMAMSNNDANTAVKMTSKAVLLEPNNPDYKEQQAEITYRIGNSKGAAQISESIIDSFPRIRMHYKRTVFYYEKAEAFEDAARVLNRFEKQFGFTYQTAMMFDYLYDLQDDGISKISNWSKLVNKYPNDIGYRKSQINALIDESKYAEANVALDQLAEKMDHPGYTYLVKSRISSIQKDWSNYISHISRAASDPLLDGKLKTRYLVESVEIKDTSILAPIRLVAAEDPAAETYLNFYLKQFGQSIDEAKNLKAQYKANPSDDKLAEKLSITLYARGKYEEASKISLELVESNPSLVQYYHLHAKNLMAQGKFADAYSYANQGLTYSISKNELCFSHILQTQANFYLGKAVNVRQELEKAWANKGSSNTVRESLCYWSMLSGDFAIQLTSELKTLQSDYMNPLYALFTSDNYSVQAWTKLEELNKGNIRVVEAHLLSANKSKSSKEAAVLKSRLKTLFPSHDYYINFKLNE